MWCSFVFILAIAGFSQGNIILKPTKGDSFEAGFIFVQGASIPSVNYQKYALELQKNSMEIYGWLSPSFHLIFLNQ